MDQSDSTLPPEISSAVQSSHPHPVSPSKRFDLRWLTTILPGLVVLLTYFPSIRYDFVWDDLIFLPVYRNPYSWQQAIFQPFVMSSNYFRPLGVLIFISELRIGGLDPSLFHFTNLILHTINTVLVSLLALIILLKIAKVNKLALHGLPLAIGLIYGLHPVLIEGVVFVSSLFDLLITMFLLLALLADQTVKGKIRPILLGGLFLLACLAKEMAVAFVLALPFWHLAFASYDEAALPEAQSNPNRFDGWKYLLRQIEKNISIYVALFVAGLIYLTIRYASLGYIIQSQPKIALRTGNMLQQFLLVAKSVATYLLLIIWPFNLLSPIHFSEMPIPASDFSAWLSVVLLVLLVAGLIVLVRRHRVAGYLGVGGVLALLPVINILPLELNGGALVAERFLTFPLTIFALTLGAWAFDFSQTGQNGEGAQNFTLLHPLPIAAIYGVMFVWLATCFATIYSTLPNWRDNLSLWTWAAARAPRSAVPPSNLAKYYNEHGQYETGLTYAQDAITLNPADGISWNNLGVALFNLGKYSEAQNAAQRAVDLEPQSPLFLNNLAATLLAQGNVSEGKQILLEKVIQLDPYSPDAHINLCMVYLLEDRPDLANQYIQKARQLLPPDQVNKTQPLLVKTLQPERWLKLGDLLMRQGDYASAAGAYDQAGQLGAPLADVANGLSLALIELKDWDNAQFILDQAIESSPLDARLYNNLGVVAREKGDLEAARQFFQKAVELDPDWDMPQQNLRILLFGSG